LDLAFDMDKEYLAVILNHLRQIPIDFDKILRYRNKVNSSGNTNLHKVVGYHTESSLTNFDQFCQNFKVNLGFLILRSIFFYNKGPSLT
jgi:hypothetical protein